MTQDKPITYMLLNRLQSDCYTWLSGGGKLWGITPEDHMVKMLELWNSLDVKPEWLTLKELKRLHYKLLKKELNTGKDKTMYDLNKDAERLVKEGFSDAYIQSKLYAKRSYYGGSGAPQYKTGIKDIVAAIAKARGQQIRPVD